jgi:hypothetical protein
MYKPRVWFAFLGCKHQKIEVREVDGGFSEERTKPVAHLLTGELGVVIRGTHLRYVSV